MITKEQFVNFITYFQEFQTAIERLEKALGGDKPYSNVYLFECDWYQAVDKMLSEFGKIHFTEVGEDLIYWQIFEDVDHTITEKDGTEIDVNDLGDLYDYMIKYKEDYFNV